MKKISVFCFLILNACATNQLLYVDEQHNGIFQANCSGKFYTIGKCFQLAANQCPWGFEIIKQSEQVVGSTFDADTFGNSSTNFNMQTDATIVGNPYYANMFMNTNGYANTYSNQSTYAQQNYIINRFVIYKCK